MNKKFKPLLIVGLGKHGIEIGQGLYDTISGKNSDLARLIGCLFLDDEGNFTTSERKEIIFHCEGLDIEHSSGVFQENFKAFENNEKQIEDLLADLMQEIKRIEVVLELRESGYKIDEGITICIVSTLFDSIGSPAIIPFLGFIQYLNGGRFAGTIIQTNLLGFFPDLFDEFKKNDIAYLRSFTTLQELEHVLNNPKILSPDERSPIHFPFLFTGKNEDAAEIGSYKDLIPVIGEVFSSLTLGEIPSDESFASALLNVAEGKYTRYCSLGLSKLVYPMREVMDGLANMMVHKILELHCLITPKVYERGYIASEVKEFIVGNGLDRLSENIRIEKEGIRIWSDFKYSGSINERVIVSSYLDDIEAQSLEYNRNIVTIQDKKLVTKKEELLSEKTAILVGTIRRALDDLGKGIIAGKGTFYAQAFLDVLEDSPSPYLKGEVVGESYNLELIEKEIKSFFDKLFGVNRGRLIELKRDIDDKKSVLKNFSESETNNLSSSQEEKDEEATRRVNILITEIQNLQNEHDTLEKQIKDFDFKINDPSERRKLLQNLLKQKNEQKGAIKESLEKTDSDYRQERRKLDELYEKRKKIFYKLILIYPALFTISYIVGVCLGTFFLPPIIKIVFLVTVALVVYLILLSLYSIWAFFKYWNGVRREIMDSEYRTEHLKNEKISFLLKVQEFYNEFYKITFEHTLQGYLLSWINDYRLLVRKTGQSLQSFIEAIGRAADSGRIAYETVSFPNSIFIRSVVTKNDLDKFVKENVRLSVEIEHFFREHPLSIFFNEFRGKNNLSTFIASVKSFSEDIFTFVKEKSIEDYLRESEPLSNLNRTEKLINLFNSAKAFMYLGVEKGQDVSQPADYFGVEKSDSSDSKELLKKQGYDKISYYSSGNKRELTMTKLKIGFPAFHIALIKHGKQLADKSQNLAEYYVNSEWEMEDVFPREYILGKEDRELRKLICMGRAFNFIVKKGKNIYFENSALGKSEDDVVEFLKSFKGGTQRLKLLNIFEEKKSTESSIDQLIAYRERRKLKGLDLELVNELINELSPLS